MKRTKSLDHLKDTIRRIHASTWEYVTPMYKRDFSRRLIERLTPYNTRLYEPTYRAHVCIILFEKIVYNAQR